MTAFEHVGVAGAGAFGTALALVAHKAGRRVTLWGRDPLRVAAIQAAGQNEKYLPDTPIPAEIALTSEPGQLQSADILLMVAPAQATRPTAERFAPHLRPGTPVVACGKGIERATGRRQTEIIAECLAGARPAALSGPGWADEIAAGLPTAMTIAAPEIELADQLAVALSSEMFRLYASDDIIGVELGGAIKNVLAIACGIVIGKERGESARAALISRSLAEMKRLGEKLGARPETFMGLSGLGDLVLTATSEQSRNTSFGVALGRGRPLAELITKQLVEGVYSARIAAEIAAGQDVQTPIIAAVADIVEGRIDINAAITALLSRPLRREAG